LRLGVTYCNYITQDIVLGIKPGLALGADGLHSIENMTLWYESHRVTFEEVCKKWGVSEMEFDKNLNPLLQSFFGKPVERATSEPRYAPTKLSATTGSYRENRQRLPGVKHGD